MFSFEPWKGTFLVAMISLKKMLLGLESLIFGERDERWRCSTEHTKICDHKNCEQMEFVLILMNLDTISNICYKITNIMSFHSISKLKDLILDLKGQSSGLRVPPWVLALLPWTFKVLVFCVLFLWQWRTFIWSDFLHLVKYDLLSSVEMIFFYFRIPSKWGASSIKIEKSYPHLRVKH